MSFKRSKKCSNIEGQYRKLVTGYDSNISACVSGVDGELIVSQQWTDIIGFYCFPVWQYFNGKLHFFPWPPCYEVTYSLCKEILLYLKMSPVSSCLQKEDDNSRQPPAFLD